MIRLLAFPDLATRGIGYTHVHIARLERAGQFPRRVRLGGNRVGWIEAEVDAWFEAKIAERDRGAADATR